MLTNDAPGAGEATWEPVQRVRMHEQVLTQIEQNILDGTLRPGQRLPSERELVNALGVSRTSVREALRALEAMGIIEARTGSGQDAGSIITERTTPALTNLLRLHLALTNVSLAELVETRAQLERNAARAAATTRAKTDLEELTDLVGQMRTTTTTTDAHQQFNTLDAEFHITIARISGKTLTTDLLQVLRGAVESEMVNTFARLSDWHATADTLITEHDAIVRAIEDRDGEQAAQLTFDHITNFYQARILGS